MPARRGAEEARGGIAEAPRRREDAPRAAVATSPAWHAQKAANVAPKAIGEDTLARLAEEGTEVEVRAGATSVHIVPEHTEQDRLEVSFSEYALIQSVLDVFPGAELVSLVKRPKHDGADSPKRKVFELHVTDALRERVSRLNPVTGIERK